MFKDDKRIRMFCGHYGSGKTEFAVNYVTKLKEEVGSERKVVISDMDIVNPYFRSREKTGELEERASLFTAHPITTTRIYQPFPRK